MNHQDDFDRTVRAWFEGDAAPTAPRHLLESILADTRARRPRVGWMVRFGLSGSAGTLVGASRTSRLMILFALLAALLIGLVGGALLAGGPHRAVTSVIPSTRPTTGPTLLATEAPTRLPVAGAVDLETVIQRFDPLVPGITYTSSRFVPQVTFKLKAAWCGPTNTEDAFHQFVNTGERSIVFSLLQGCVTRLWFIRPASVDCGTPTEHPDAATLAAAILANRGLGARDLGTLESPGAVPSTLFAGTYPGRVVQVDTSRAFDPTANDPDHCRLILTPPISGAIATDPPTVDPNFEVRADLSSKLIMTDVNGELVVMFLAQAGYDATTGSVPYSGHYGGGPGNWDSLLSGIYDVKFGP